MKKGQLVTWKFGPAGITYVILSRQKFQKEGITMCKVFGSNGKMDWINKAQLQSLKNIQ